MKRKVITAEELAEFLGKHKLWLENKEGGERADLGRADLGRADLLGADLRGADLRGADLGGADLGRADLREADLREADLRGADLERADLDYSCLPLWCGSLSANFDDKQLKQIAYHLVKAGLSSNNASEETKAELVKLIDFANGFHRIKECGKIEYPKCATDNNVGDKTEKGGGEE